MPASLNLNKFLKPLFLILLFSAALFLNPVCLYASWDIDDSNFPEIMNKLKIKESQGSLTVSYTDISIPALGFPLELSRTYHSQSSYLSPLGYGWTANFSVGITEIKDLLTDTIKVVSPEGIVIEFHRQPNGTYATLEREKQTLVKNPDGTLTIKRKEGSTETLDAKGRLIKKTDLNGNSISFIYTYDKLTKITDASDRSLDFTYIGNFITKVTDPLNKVYQYAYDANDNLIETTDPLGNKTKFQYDNRHNLTKITYPNQAVINIGYTNDRKENVKAASVEGPEGLTRSYKYAYVIRIDKPEEEINTRQPFRTLKTDSYGNTTQHLYTTKQKCLKIKDPYGNTRTRIKNDRLDPLSYKDENGNQWIYTYDSDGNMLTKTSPLNELWSYTYEPNFNKIKSETDPNLNRTLYDYDQKGNLIKVTDAEGNITTYGYYPNGLLKTITEPKGNPDASYTTTFEYDSYGDKTRITDALGNQTIFAYDLAGHLISNTTPETNTTTYEYDPLNRLTKITDPKSNTTQYSYDSMGNVISIISTDNLDPQNPHSIATSYEYNLLNKLVKIIDPLGNITQYAYNLEADISQIIDPEGNKTTYEYDKTDRLVQVKRWTTQTGFYATQYEYDKTENRTAVTDSALNRTQYEYDPLNRIFKTIDSKGNITQYQYDKTGNLKYLTDAQANATSYEYDKIYRLIKTTDAEGQNTRYEYDKNSNKTKLIDPNSNITTFAYDQLNRLILTTYPDSSTESLFYQIDTTNKIYKLTKTDRKGQAIAYNYDYANRLIKKVYPNASNVTYAYDGLNRNTAVTDQTGTIHYDYDLLGRLTEVTYPDNKTIGYEYNKTGCRTKLIYPDSSFITYTYDKFNRLTVIATLSGVEEEAISTYSYLNDLPFVFNKTLGNNTYTDYTYDNLYQITNISNKDSGQRIADSYSYGYDKTGNKKYVLHNHDSSKGDVYTYDDIYQVTNVKYNVLNPVSESQTPGSSTFEYQKTYNLDPVGNRTSLVNGGTTTYTHNNLNQYTVIARGGEPASYSYDLNGNLSAVSRQGIAVSYSYDYDNRLTNVSFSAQAGNPDTQYTYDAFGRRIEKSIADSPQSTVKYVYDGDNVIAEYDNDNNLIAKYVHGPRIDEVIRLTLSSSLTYYYHLDTLGSVTEITDSTGAIVEKYSYDIYGAPTIKDAAGNILSQSSIGNSYLFTAREYDYETNLYYYRARYYNVDIGRFLQTDPIGYAADLNLYRYCGNNPVNEVDPLGLFYFGKRPLGWLPWIPVLSSNPRDDDLNTEISHEQGFFEDEPQPGEPRNIGFGDKGRIYNDDIAKYKEFDSKHYDDDLMRQAYKNIKDGKYSLLGLDGKKKNNCQDWAERLRKEYERLEKEKKEKEKKKSKCK